MENCVLERLEATFKTMETDSVKDCETDVSRVSELIKVNYFFLISLNCLINLFLIRVQFKEVKSSSSKSMMPNH